MDIKEIHGMVKPGNLVELVIEYRDRYTGELVDLHIREERVIGCDLYAGKLHLSEYWTGCETIQADLIASVVVKDAGSPLTDRELKFQPDNELTARNIAAREEAECRAYEDSPEAIRADAEWYRKYKRARGIIATSKGRHRA